MTGRRWREGAGRDLRLDMGGLLDSVHQNSTKGGIEREREREMYIRILDICTYLTAEWKGLKDASAFQLAPLHTSLAVCLSTIVVPPLPISNKTPNGAGL